VTEKSGAGRAELGDNRRFMKQNQRYPEQQDKWAQKNNPLCAHEERAQARQ
jgi:hypothetical protein